ncbi:hypothetical protein BDV96DRAFT_173688 [Lophiotrema nucula]|uniref:Uncharacterized protein n=1 Tax=Lophiotrema nucula TaxID=690887 RepID=A0A6A5YX16_9PLEO|nr:hypothetical protein BDV96DRAFT_173688 [Lophiotrema nucula]
MRCRWPSHRSLWGRDLVTRQGDPKTSTFRCKSCYGRSDFRKHSISDPSCFGRIVNKDAPDDVGVIANRHTIIKFRDDQTCASWIGMRGHPTRTESGRSFGQCALCLGSRVACKSRVQFAPRMRSASACSPTLVVSESCLLACSYDLFRGMAA